MQAMISDDVWSEELAKMYEITKQDVQLHHSIHLRMTVLMNHGIESEFKAHLKHKGLEAYRVEREKADNYRSGSNGKEIQGSSLFRRWLATAKFFALLRSPHVEKYNMQF